MLHNQQKLALGVQMGWLSAWAGAELLGALLQPRSGVALKASGEGRALPNEQGCK